MTLTRYQAASVSSSLMQGQLVPFQSLTCSYLSSSSSLSLSAPSVNILPVLCAFAPLIDRLESRCLMFQRDSVSSSLKYYWHLPYSRNAVLTWIMANWKHSYNLTTKVLCIQEVFKNRAPSFLSWVRFEISGNLSVRTYFFPVTFYVLQERNNTVFGGKRKWQLNSSSCCFFILFGTLQFTALLMCKWVNTINSCLESSS